MYFTFRVPRLAILLAAIAVSAPAWALSDAQIQKIQQAVPKQATAKADEPRRVLVFSQALGFVHSSIPHAEKAFQLMGEATGAFTVDVSSDPAVFEPQNLEKYDAIVLNNNTGEWLTTPTLRQSLLSFVRDGKGLVGIHAATDGNFKWEEFGELIGGYFHNHPWQANGTITMKLDQPDHPVVQAFAGQSLEINDEIYQITDPYSREKVLTVMSIDTEKTDMNKEGIIRTDGDFPISWVREYGEGRVFYSSLGHNEHLYANPVVLQHYLDGLQFALGDLEGNARPTPAQSDGAAPTSDGRPTTGTAATKPVDDEELRAALAELDDYDFGDNRDFLLTIDAAMRTSADNPQQREALLRTLIEKANNADLTFAARDLALRRIGDIAPPEAVGSIQALVASEDQKLANSAIRTLTNIPGDAVDEAFLSHLEKAGYDTRIAIINALGARRTASDQAISQLTSVAGSGEPAEQTAAIIALGKIGTTEAGNALLNDVQVGDATRETWLAALNNAANNIAEQDKDLARTLYDRVSTDGAESAARLAAFRGKAQLDGNPEAVALAALGDGATGGIGEVARQILVRGNNAEVAQQLLERLRTADGDMKITLVEILGARGEKAALEPVTELAARADENVPQLQVAAIRALKQIGDQGSVAILLQVAADQRGEPATAAKETLAGLRSTEVDDELVRMITSAPSPDQQVAAIEAVVARKSGGAVDPLLQAAASDDMKVASAAFKALSEVASAEHLDRLLEIHDKLREDRTIREAGRTITSVVRGATAKAQAVSRVQEALQTASEDTIKASLLGVLGRIGGTMALETLRQHLADTSNEAMRDAAVRALAEFPGADALDDLMKIASESESEIHRVLALRAVARLLAEGDGNAAPRLDMARQALEIATGDEEKKAIIGAVAELKTTGVLEFLLPFLDEDALKEETAAAIITHAPIAEQIDAGKTAELLNPMRDKLSSDQWNKLEEVLTPGDDSGQALRAYQISRVVDEGKSPQDSISQDAAPDDSAELWASIFWAGIDSGGSKKGRGNIAQWYPSTENAAVYLRTHVWSPDERTVELRSGSDDGLRLWVNGETAFTTSPTRAFNWEDDKEKISLKRGWNTLLFKVVQGNGQWSLAARLLNEDGGIMSDLRYSALPQQ